MTARNERVVSTDPGAAEDPRGTRHPMWDGPSLATKSPQILGAEFLEHER